MKITSTPKSNHPWRIYGATHKLKKARRIAASRKTKKWQADNAPHVKPALNLK